MNFKLGDQVVIREDEDLSLKVRIGDSIIWNLLKIQKEQIPGTIHRIQSMGELTAYYVDFGLDIDEDNDWFWYKHEITEYSG